MAPLIITVIITFVLTLIAIIGLAISWFITGKSSIIRGACGMDPNRVRDARCGTDAIHCALCEKDQDKEDRVVKRVQKYEVENEESLPENETADDFKDKQ